MNKTIKKLTLLIPAAAMVLSAVLAPQTFAVSSTVYDGGVDTIPLKRTITNVSNKVTNTFGYTVVADAGNPTGAANEPVSASVSFSAASPDTNHSVLSTGVIDFSQTTYTKPGDYYYTVTEASSTDGSNFPIDSTSYTAIAAVRYAENGGVIDQNTLVVTLLQMVRNSSGAKVDALWTSAAPRTYSELVAHTTGNMADPTHCFAYTINVATGSGISAGDSFALSTNSTCSNNPTSVTVGTGAVIYLKDGDTMQVGLSGGVYELPIGSGYSVTLNDAEGYTATFNGDTMVAGTPQTLSGLVAVGPGFDSTNIGEIILTKDSSVPTGIFTNIFAYMALFGVGACGIIYIGKKARNTK